MKRILATALILTLAAPTLARAQDSLTVIRGTPPANRAPAENFTGTARVGSQFQAEAPARIYGATVAFEPGARTHWHVPPSARRSSPRPAPDACSTGGARFGRSGPATWSASPPA